MPSMSIEHLYISPGHNFFGRHGLSAGLNPLQEVADIECIAGHGLRGDRFFDYKVDYKGQITFFSGEVFEDVCHALGIHGRAPGTTRRNVITRGADLNNLIGRNFSVQGVDFEGVAECKPCYWMDFAIGQGAESALQGRGGLRARILTSGFLRPDYEKSLTHCLSDTSLELRFGTVAVHASAFPLLHKLRKITPK